MTKTEPYVYVYQPYPKARYRNGVYMAVANEAEHAVAEADGWTDWHTDQARMAATQTDTEPQAEKNSKVPSEVVEKVRRKPGRPPKQQ